MRTGPALADRARPCRLAALAAALLLAVAATAATPDPTERAATAGDCQSLLHQFDVAWPAHRDGPRAASAQHSRDLGEADCRQNHFGDGVRHLRRALHDIGVKPVKIASVRPAH
jgi:hypothetical protein